MERDSIENQDIASMFLGYSCYPIDLGSCGSVNLAQLDKVTVAGALSASAQAELANVAPFAQQAYRTIHDEKYFLSLLFDPRSVEKEPEKVNTNGGWITHLKLLRKWGVVDILVVNPALCLSKYFAILKSNGMARTIFSGAKLSSLFKRPPPVNLPGLPVVLSLLSDILRGEKFYFLCADLRHYFHQISLNPDLMRYFSIRCHGELWGYLVLPMGWSHSPRIAQCYAWVSLLDMATEENGLARSAREFLAMKPEHPPSFMLLHDVRGCVVGLVLIWYDNFLFWSTNQEIALSLFITLSAMTKRWGLVWGEKKLWHPKQLDVQSAELNPDIGVALGLQFARRVKRGRDDPNHHLVWRLKPKTAVRAEEFSKLKEWTCRNVAGVVGSAVWQCYVSCQPFSKIHHALELVSRVGRHAKTHGWQTHFKLSNTDRATIARVLTNLADNPWHGSSIQRDWTQIRIVASDASLQRGAWVFYTACDCRARWHSWDWSAEIGESIFLLELRAAISAIKAVSTPNGIFVIVIDNTAAAEVLRTRYSTTAKGRDLLDDLHTFLEQHHIFLIVAGIAGLDNDADAPTRGNKENPKWCSRRLEATWRTGVRTMYGSERLRLNPLACVFGHAGSEVEYNVDDNTEDNDCENLTISIDRLMNCTALE